jgi:hypothetical protein
MLLKQGRERDGGLNLEFDVISNQRRGLLSTTSPGQVSELEAWKDNLDLLFLQYLPQLGIMELTAWCPIELQTFKIRASAG